MPFVYLSQELGVEIKELRIKNKIKSKDISAAIDKSPTYFSKLEKGEIQKIDYDDLMKIFHTIFPDRKIFEVRFEEFINKCTLKYSEDEFKKQTWIMNFDTVYRQIPIPPELVDYCNKQMEIAKISMSEVVARINLNEDIANKNLDYSKYNKNEWYWENEWFAVMDISSDDIEKILNRQNQTANYITIEALVYNILKFLIPDFVQAHAKTIEILTSFKFYSIVEKNRKLAQTHSPEELDEILTDFDKVNDKLKRNIIKNIERFSTLNIKYANEKLMALSNNFDADAPITIAYLGVELSALKDLDINTKRKFIQDIENLVEKYKTITPETEEIILL